MFYPLESLLSKLGLNTTEQKIYLNGLELGASTILQLSQKTKLNRLTVHQAVDHMIEAGIFVQIMYGEKTPRLPKQLGWTNTTHRGKKV